ncbi:protein STRUBBELIG-RECEPTOR FAMILY 2-like isoform X3 [Magnolia sinica]|uniref:protein STRUBBELIG-RECEPTOR FAMILY 2-like isoform X3 n=1 Tax=Magnolia sinica TaxID=86752 RepID=UPI00265AEA9F|nr:protein STRUBBELIG-RECEPTOR FAMILY 2-like isoform X3 [Magnolia sinica]
MMILKKLKILDTGRYIAFDEYEGIEVAWNQKPRIQSAESEYSILLSFLEISPLFCRNLSHNSLSGSIGDIFTGLKNLKQIDLQSNQFTGSVNFLAGLPLSYLYVLN